MSIRINQELQIVSFRNLAISFIRDFFVTKYTSNSEPNTKHTFLRK